MTERCDRCEYWVDGWCHARAQWTTQDAWCDLFLLDFEFDNKEQAK